MKQPVDDEGERPSGASLLRSRPAPGDDGHTHPWSLVARIAVVVYSVLLAVALVGLYLTIEREAERGEVERQRITENIMAELDARSIKRDQEQAKIRAELEAQEAATAEIVCDLLLNEFKPPSPTVNRAIRTFRCDEPPRLPERQDQTP